MKQKAKQNIPPSYYLKREIGGYYALYLVIDGEAERISEPDFLAIALSKLQTAIVDDLKV